MNNPYEPYADGDVVPEGGAPLVLDTAEQLAALWEANGRPDLDAFAEGFIGWLRATLPLYAQEMEPK